MNRTPVARDVGLNEEESRVRADRVQIFGRTREIVIEPDDACAVFQITAYKMRSKKAAGSCNQNTIGCQVASLSVRELRVRHRDT